MSALSTTTAPDQVQLLKETASISLEEGKEDVFERIRTIHAKHAATALKLRTSTAKERIAKITKLRDCVLAHRADIYKACYADFRKPEGEVDLAEIAPVCIEANAAIRSLHSWMSPKSAPHSLLIGIGTDSAVQCVPRGRTLLIGPFNYPVNLTLGPLISAVAAGNTCMIKPSELTPSISALMAKIVSECFDEDEVCLFQGEVDVAQALLALKFDHIFFTGSPMVGKIVAQAAAKNLTSVTLELGGKSPTIIDQTADIPLAAQNAMFGKFANSGQTCIAPDYIYIHESVKDKFVESCKKELVKAYGATMEAQRDSPSLAHMVNARHFVRVKSLLDDAINRGAKVMVGGQADASQNFLQPTIIENVSLDSNIMEEEIFGPILPILTYTNLDEVIAKINAGEKPLAIYLYSHNSKAVKKVELETVSGGMVVNGSLVQFLHGNLPFGGIGNSGIGNAHGFYGFKAFSHERAVVKVKWSILTGLFAAGEMPKWLRNSLQLGFKWF